MLTDALSYSLVAFKQAMQICAMASPEAARQWIVSVATWPASADSHYNLGEIAVTEQDALTMLSEAMNDAGLERDIEIASVANELHALGRKMWTTMPDCGNEEPEMLRWRQPLAEAVDRCRDRLNDLTKPKEHA